MSPKIFFAEDTKVMRALVLSWLKDGNHQVECFDDGQALHGALANELPDLIVSDVSMPHMDGFTLARAIRQEERTAHIPLILLTRLDQPQDIVQGLDSGADAFVVK